MGIFQGRTSPFAPNQTKTDPSILTDTISAVNSNQDEFKVMPSWPLAQPILGFRLTHTVLS